MLRRSTIMIVAVFIVLVGVALLLQRTDFGKDAEPTPTEQVRLLTVGSDDLDQISLEDREGNRAAFFKNEENVWLPEEDGLVIGDSAAFNNALTQLGTLRALSVIADPPEAAVIGIEPPQYRIILTGSDGTTNQMDVGNQTPTGSGYYVRIGQPDVYVVSKFNLDTVLALITSADMIATPTPEATPTVAELSTPEDTQQSGE